MKATPSGESTPDTLRLTLAGYAFTVFLSSALLLVLGTAVILFLLAVPFLRRSGRAVPAVLAIAFLGAGTVLWQRQGLTSPCTRESSYFCIREEFAFVDVWMEGMPEHPRVTFVLTASDGPRLPETVSARVGFERAWHRVTEKLMEIGTPPDELPVLTDDYAPVERLIARLLIGKDG